MFGVSWESISSNFEFWITVCIFAPEKLMWKDLDCLQPQKKC